jgi:hypothetical protein
MSNQLIATILFELLDLGIRMTENRHGDHEKYVLLREQLRKELVERANTPPAPTPDEKMSASEAIDANEKARIDSVQPSTTGGVIPESSIDTGSIVGGQGTEHL